MNYDDLKATHKCAILILSLPEVKRKKIFKSLNSYERDKVLMSITDVEMIDGDVKETVLKDFYKEVISVKGGVIGGSDKVREMILENLPDDEAKDLINRLNLKRSGVADMTTAFKDVDSTQLRNFLRNEKPQTIALILTFLESDQAAQVVSTLPESDQPEVIMRMATMGQTDPEIIAQVGRIVRSQLTTSVGQNLSSAGGTQAVADILNFVDRNTEKSILGKIEEIDQNLVEEVRKKMFVFDNLVDIDDRSMQRILKEIDTSELSLALKSASDPVKDKVFSNVSKRAAELIKEEIEYMGPVLLKDVEEAQQRIVNVVRRLEEEGEITIASKGGGDEFV